MLLVLLLFGVAVVEVEWVVYAVCLLPVVGFVPWWLLFAGFLFAGRLLSVVVVAAAEVCTPEGRSGVAVLLALLLAFVVATSSASAAPVVPVVVVVLLLRPGHPAGCRSCD